MVAATSTCAGSPLKAWSYTDGSKTCATGCCTLHRTSWPISTMRTIPITVSMRASTASSKRTRLTRRPPVSMNLSGSRLMNVRRSHSKAAVLRRLSGVLALRLTLAGSKRPCSMGEAIRPTRAASRQPKVCISSACRGCTRGVPGVSPVLRAMRNMSCRRFLRTGSSLRVDGGLRGQSARAVRGAQPGTVHAAA
jgi:hypothetical protein